MRNTENNLKLSSEDIRPMNIKELCDYLGISATAAYKLIHDGKIKSVRIGKSYHIPKIAVDNYLIEACELME